MKSKNIIPFLLIVSVLLLGFSIFNKEQLESKAPKIDMVLVKGGSFQMGQADGEFDEKPVFKVTLNDFYLGKYEVTVAQYRAFCEATGRSMPKKPKFGRQEDHPIVNTSWYDAVAFIEWYSRQTEENYRLPTEAEFDYVIREGGKPGIYPWGEGMPKNENIADESFHKEFSSRSYWKGYDDGYKYLSPIGAFPPNSLGVHDINGNVWEWVSDWHTEFTAEAKTNPTGPDKGKNKVGKGASFDADPWHSRTASRSFVEPDFTGPGFRLAKDR